MQKLYYLGQNGIHNKGCSFTLLYICLMAGLADKSRLLISDSAFSVFWYVVLVQRSKEDLTSHRPGVKKRSSLAVRYRRLSPLILDQNSASGSFWSPDAIWNFIHESFTCFYIKIHWSPCTLNGSFTHWQSGKYSFRFMQNFQMLGISHIKKSHFINFTTHLIKNVLDKYRFSKILIFAGTLEFYHWQWRQTHFVQFLFFLHF